MSHSLTPHDVLRVAVEACVDPRTVRRYLAHSDVRSSLEQRIKSALVRLQLESVLAPAVANDGDPDPSRRA